jgi:hypothetical protein
MFVAAVTLNSNWPTMSPHAFYFGSLTRVPTIKLLKSVGVALTGPAWSGWSLSLSDLMKLMRPLLL